MTPRRPWALGSTRTTVQYGTINAAATRLVVICRLSTQHYPNTKCEASINRSEVAIQRSPGNEKRLCAKHTLHHAAATLRHPLPCPLILREPPSSTYNCCILWTPPTQTHKTQHTTTTQRHNDKTWSHTRQTHH